MRNKIGFALALARPRPRSRRAAASSSSDRQRLRHVPASGSRRRSSGEQSVLGQGMLKGAQLAATELNEGDGILGKQVEVVPIDDAADPETGSRRQSRDRGRPRRHRRPLQLRRRHRNPAALHRSRPGADQADLRHLDQRARLHPAADDLPDRAGRLGGADRLARRQNRRDRLRPDPELHGLGLQGAEGVARRGGRHRDRLREGPARQEELHRRGRQARGDQARRHLRRRLLPRGRADRQGDARRQGQVAVRRRLRLLRHRLRRNRRRRGGARPARWSACRRPEDFAGAAPKVAEYRDEFGEDPGTWSPYTYDSLNFLAYGVEKAGGTDAKKLTNALDGVNGWKGWTGSVTIDPTTATASRRPW